MTAAVISGQAERTGEKRHKKPVIVYISTVMKQPRESSPSAIVGGDQLRSEGGEAGQPIWFHILGYGLNCPLAHSNYAIDRPEF